MVTPREHWAAVARDHGEAATVGWCVDLLSGAASVDEPDHPAFAALGRERQHVQAILDGSPDYWLRVWGARGLLYVWDDSAAPTVIRGLAVKHRGADEHWRVREMCAKVCRRRGLAQGVDDLARLLTDDTARVRLAAILALADLGEAEHARAIRALLDDPEPTVRAAADRAIDAMSERLDRDLRNAEDL